MQDGYSLAYGARFLKRVIEDRIKLPISQRWTEGTHFVVNVRDGKIEIDDLERRRLSARRNRLAGLNGPDEGRLLPGGLVGDCGASIRFGCAGIDVARRRRAPRSALAAC